MGKLTGFMEYERLEPPGRDPKTRVRDWMEFHDHLPEATLREQGARCMDCGVPFCHTGTLLPGGASGCPINNLIPEWNDLVYRGQWREALARLHKTNNFPEFTGAGLPGALRGLVRARHQRAGGHHQEHRGRDHRQGLRRGLGRPRAARQAHRQEGRGRRLRARRAWPAAAQLNSAGHTVTVFERDDRIGGLLMYGIPPMKLDKRSSTGGSSCWPRRASSFVTNAWVGKTYPTEKLRKEFDAVVLCGGATRARDLPVEGRNLGGVHFAMEFLLKSCKSLLDSNFADGKFIAAKGKHVVVIGGGDTGTDCVGTALRHGCKSLVQFEILARPPGRPRATTTPGRSGRASTSSTTARRRRRRCSAPTRAPTAPSPSASSATRPATSRSCTPSRSSGSRTATAG